jgi:hypothetical protein
LAPNIGSHTRIRTAQLKFVSASRAFAGFLLLSIACSVPGKPSDPANGKGDPDHWSYTLTASPSEFTITQGGTDTVIVTITRAGGFTGPVALQANLPPGPGITVVVQDITTTGVTTTSRVIVTLGGAYPLGANSLFLGSTPANDQVEQPAGLELHMNVTRKNGVFILTQQSISIGKGQSGSVRVVLARTAFDGPVPMSLATNVAGLTATYSPNPVIDTVTQMTLSVASTVAEGTYSVGVRAFEGVTGQQATGPLSLIVTAPGSISFAFTTNPLFLPKNATVPTGVIITRTNYSGPVTFTLSGVPAGVNAIVNNPAIGNNFQISFGGTAAAVAGNYPIVVTASGEGLQNVSATLTLNVGG